MKIYINDNGTIEKVEEAGLISGSWGKNYIDLYFQDDVDYVSLSAIRNDSFEIRNLLIPKTQKQYDTTNNLFYWRYEVEENDPLISIAGQLQLSANFVKLTIITNDEGLVLAEKEYVIATMIYTTQVLKSVNIRSQEEYDAFIEGLTKYREEVMASFSKIKDLEDNLSNFQVKVNKQLPDTLKLFTISENSVTAETLEKLIEYQDKGCIALNKSPELSICFFSKDDGNSLVYQGNVSSTLPEIKTANVLINKTNRNITIQYINNLQELGYEVIEEYQSTQSQLDTTFNSLSTGIYLVNTFIYGNEIWIKNTALNWNRRITPLQDLFLNSLGEWEVLYTTENRFNTLFSNDGKIKSEYIPAIAITETFVVNSIEDMLNLEAQVGDVAVILNVGSYILKEDNPKVLDNWIILSSPTNAVLSVNGKIGAVTLLMDDIPDSEEKLVDIKNQAIEETLEKVQKMDLGSSSNPTTTYVLRQAEIEKLDKNGNVIDVLEPTLAEIGADKTSNFGVLMEFFRELLGMGETTQTNIPIGEGSQGERARFLVSTDYDNVKETLGSNLYDYFTFENPMEYAVDSFIVECIGGKSSSIECTFTINLYDKKSNHYRLQVCSTADGYSTNGWENLSKNLELLDLTTYQNLEGVSSETVRKVYENPRKYLISANIDGITTQLLFENQYSTEVDFLFVVMINETLVKKGTVSFKNDETVLIGNVVNIASDIIALTADETEAMCKYYQTKNEEDIATMPERVFSVIKSGKLPIIQLDNLTIIDLLAQAYPSDFSDYINIILTAFHQPFYMFLIGNFEDGGGYGYIIIRYSTLKKEKFIVGQVYIAITEDIALWNVAYIEEATIEGGGGLETLVLTENTAVSDLVLEGIKENPNNFIVKVSGESGFPYFYATYMEGLGYYCFYRPIDLVDQEGQMEAKGGAFDVNLNYIIIADGTDDTANKGQWIKIPLFSDVFYRQDYIDNNLPSYALISNFQMANTTVDSVIRYKISNYGVNSSGVLVEYNNTYYLATPYQTDRVNAIDEYYYRCITIKDNNLINFSFKINTDTGALTMVDSYTSTPILTNSSFKTINGQSVIGEGDITIEGGSSITVDGELKDDSENPVQNKVINSKLNSITSDISDVQAQATQLETTQNNLQNEVNNLKNSKVDTSTYNTKISSIDTNITTLTTSVNSANTEISSLKTSKVDKTTYDEDINNVNTRVDDTNTAVNLLSAQKINVSDVATINGQSIINGGNIELADIGSRVGLNLELNKNFMGKTLFFDTETEYVAYPISFTYTFANSSGTTTAKLIGSSSVDETGIVSSANIYLEIGDNDSLLIYNDSTGWNADHYTFSNGEDYNLISIIDESSYGEKIISVGASRPIILIDEMTLNESYDNQQLLVPSAKATHDLVNGVNEKVNELNGINNIVSDLQREVSSIKGTEEKFKKADYKNGYSQIWSDWIYVRIDNELDGEIGILSVTDTQGQNEYLYAFPNDNTGEANFSIGEKEEGCFYKSIGYDKTGKEIFKIGLTSGLVVESFGQSPYSTFAYSPIQNSFTTILEKENATGIKALEKSIKSIEDNSKYRRITSSFITPVLLSASFSQVLYVRYKKANSRIALCKIGGETFFFRGPEAMDDLNTAILELSEADTDLNILLSEKTQLIEDGLVKIYLPPYLASSVIAPSNEDDAYLVEPIEGYRETLECSSDDTITMYINDNGEYLINTDIVFPPYITFMFGTCKNNEEVGKFLELHDIDSTLIVQYSSGKTVSSFITIGSLENLENIYPIFVKVEDNKVIVSMNKEKYLS